MKTIKIITLSAVTILATIAVALPAHADEITNSKKATPTEVQITDATDPKDPLDPEDPEKPVDPNQAHLVLNKVPSAYKFTSTVSNREYSITDGQIDNGVIEVFNDRTNRQWSVKASVAENKLSLNTNTFAVSSFKLNDEEIVGTGATGVVFNSADTDGIAGTKTKTVDNISISFTDPNGVLKPGDTINGLINYQLFNTVNPN